MEHHPKTKGERVSVKQSIASRCKNFKESWDSFKHHAEHNIKKLSPTRRQLKAAISEKEQINILDK